jgi:rubrerythrin
MTAADQIRARLDAYAAQEAANPSPVWAPIEHDDQPEQCPMCAATAFDFDPNHDDGISMGPAWLCTGCRWGVRSVPNPMIARPTTEPGAFTAEEIRLCHEATEFDHQCRVCTAEEERPDEAIPGTDF